MLSFRDAIDAHAAAQPDAPFLLAPESGSVLTYGELRRAARSLGSYLASEGIPPGSVVSFMLPNGVSAASILLGGMYCGHVVSPLNLLAQDSQIAYVLAHSETRLVFAATDFIDRVKGLCREVRSHAMLRPTDPDRLDLSSAELSDP